MSEGRPAAIVSLRPIPLGYFRGEINPRKESMVVGHHLLKGVNFCTHGAQSGAGFYANGQVEPCSNGASTCGGLITLSAHECRCSHCNGFNFIGDSNLREFCLDWLLATFQLKALEMKENLPKELLTYLPKPNDNPIFDDSIARQIGLETVSLPDSSFGGELTKLPKNLVSFGWTIFATKLESQWNIPDMDFMVYTMLLMQKAEKTLQERINSAGNILNRAASHTSWLHP